jgi:hypothetical protein
MKLKRICLFFLVISFIIVFTSCGGGSSSVDTTPSVSTEPTPEQPPEPTPDPTPTPRQITLQWQPNSETNLAGYLVFMHEEGKQYDYTNPIWDIVETECDVYDLDENMRYYFVVRAYDTENCESEDSNEAILEPK